MPFSQKPIVTVIYSDNLSSIDFSVFINPNHCGAIITSTVNDMVEKWAKTNRLECLVFEPNWNIFGKKAVSVCYEEMVDAADAVIVFWNGDMHDRKIIELLQYCYKSEKKCLCHMVEEF